jgi:hypothetical protein
MASLRDAIIYDAERVFVNTDEYGESVTYTDANLSPTALTISVLFDVEEWQDEDGNKLSDVSTIFAPVADFDGNTPIRSGTITRGAEIWTINKDIRKTEGGYLLKVEKNLRIAPDEGGL